MLQMRNGKGSNTDQQFKKNCSNRFKLPTSKRRQGTSLRINEQVVTDHQTILATWEDHFKNISAANEDQFPVMPNMKVLENHLKSASLKNEDYLLDVPFCADEVDAVLKKLKSGKAAGHDLLQAEHLKYGTLLSVNGLNKSAMQSNIWSVYQILSKLVLLYPYIRGEAKTRLTPTATGELQLPQCWPKS